MTKELTSVVGFDELAKLAYIEAGLIISRSKATMIQSRLRHRLQALSLSNLLDYCAYVQRPENYDERKNMISALTTNVTSFFREPHHFEYLVEKLAPAMHKRLMNGEAIRMWSAGCSKGQEPYSIAMSLADYSNDFSNKDFRILATDIDQTVLSIAKQGIYTQSQLTSITQKQMGYLEELEPRGAELCFQVSTQIRNMISFKELNLMRQWPMKRKFDAVFCRNVVIYFDGKTQDDLWPRYHTILNPDGHIFVGHSERVNYVGFDAVGPTVYRRKSMQTSNAIKPVTEETKHGIT